MIEESVWGSLQFVSYTTRLDQDGTLCGVVKVLRERPVETPGTALPCANTPYIIVLRMSRKEEAMIDCFKVEEQTEEK